MRHALALLLAMGCTASDDAYFAYRDGAIEERLLQSDRLVRVSQGRATTIGSVPGGFVAGQEAIQEFPPAASETRFTYVSGGVAIPVSEAVWRQAKGIPPFVDAL